MSETWSAPKDGKEGWKQTLLSACVVLLVGAGVLVFSGDWRGLSSAGEVVPAAEGESHSCSLEGESADDVTLDVALEDGELADPDSAADAALDAGCMDSRWASPADRGSALNLLFSFDR